MMKKVWLVLLAVVLVFGLAMLGCSSGGSGGGGGGDEFVPFEFDGPWDDIIKAWGSNSPTVTGNEVSITASSSTGFKINFEDIGYTLNRSDILIISYEIDVTTPVAVVIAKNPNGNNLDDLAGTGNAGWGKGKGWEYALGDPVRSVYDGPLVASTWDGTTGTFEVLMRLFPANATGIGFQHNVWADDGGNGIKIAEHSVYKVKITNIKNKGGEAPVDPVVPPPPETNGTKLVIKVAGVDQDTTVTGVSGTVGYLDDNNGYAFTRGASWQASYAYFPVSLGTNKLSDFDKVKFKYQGVSGDIGYKQIFLVANDAAFSGGLGGGSDDGVAALTITDQKQMNGTDVTNVELTVTRTKASAYDSKTTMYFTIFFNSRGTTSATDDTPTVFIISDIEFVKAAAPFVPVVVNTTIAGVTAPAAGGTPKASISTDEYTGAIEWEGTLSDDNKFVLGTTYTAKITLTKKVGYTFNGILADAFTVTGATSTTNLAGTTGDTILVTATFPAAVAGEPVVVWQPTITAATGMATAEYINGNLGIKRDATVDEMTIATIDGGISVTLVSGQYKQFCIQVGGGDVGGSNYYWNAENGFKPNKGDDYTITFMASVASGTGKLRLNGNGAPGGSDPWAQTESLDTTPKAVTYSWTQNTGNLKFDTGDSDVGTVINITGIKITTP